MAGFIPAMIKARCITHFLGISILLSGVWLHGQRLEAGAARVDITPPLGMPLQGYPESGRGAMGVRDPL